MKYYYTGTFAELEDLGFVQDFYEEYYYFPKHTRKYLVPLTIMKDDMMIELASPEQLKIIAGKYTWQK